MSLKYQALTIAILGSALAACGGGSSDGGSTTTPVTRSGTAVDFYVSGATVTFLDCNNQTTTTNAKGAFTFPTGCTDSAITIKGGTDIGTGLPFEETLQAPKGMSSASGIVVTPLSTLYAISGETNLASFATKLGLSGKDLATKDPMADKELLQAAITSQQLIVQTKKVLLELSGSVGGSLTAEQAEASVKAALKANLANTTTLDLKTATSLPVQSIIQNAISQSKSSLPVEIQNNLDNIAANTAALMAAHVTASVNTANQAIANATAEADGSIKLETLAASGGTAAISQASSSQSANQIFAIVGTDAIKAPDAASALSTLGAAIASQDTNTVANAIALVNTKLPDDKKISSDKADDLASATQYSNYLGVLNVGFNGGTAYDISKVLASVNAGSELTASGTIDKFSLNLAQFGNAFVSAPEAKLGLNYVISSSTAQAPKTISVIFDKVSFSFDGSGAITAFKLPANVKYSYSITGGSTAIPTSDYTNQKENSYAVSNGTVTLSLSELLDRLVAVNPSFKKDDYLPRAGDKVTFTVALASSASTNAVRVGTGSGTTAKAATGYTISSGSNTFVGTGFKAVVNVQ
ncbi:hypothetical protein RFY41_08600 [Acinetobacter soli]|uniref:hypothetical protein n=1 Tax=Acinetobacter soli TaxID=487316 RepID=UPI002813819A|nr:hypothetical protein [Acinetobacter soli]MDQ9833089.1 hypothetical protein [Acinetobacter soli]